jgi:PAS domain S-box-containing protein
MQRSRQTLFLASSLVLIFVSVLVEQFSPSGVYLGCGLVVAVMLTLFTETKTDSIIVSVIACVAILYSVLYQHTTEEFRIVTINHVGSLTGVMTTMFFVMYVKKLREQSLLDSKQMTSLFTNATEGIMLANREGKIILANPVAEKMFGFAQEELIGKKVEMLLPSAIRQKHVQQRSSFNENPVNRSMGGGRDLFAQRKDGTVFPVEISLSHYRSGREAYVIAFIIDISIRKKNEEILNSQRNELEKVSREIKLLNTQLEQKVEDRTMMLRETLEQLNQSKNELAESLEKEKELSDLKSRFVSTVSHEFRTPLSAILSSASLIGKYKQGEEQERREKHIERIKESVKHLNDMLDDLLSLGKLEEGLIKINIEVFDFAKFITEFTSEMQELAKKNQLIELDYESVGEIKTDKRLLKNILLNLTSNAIKFSDEGMAIRIACKRISSMLQISILDSGIGISAEDREHLFERFFRARNAANIQGTGLGLHIILKYLELLGGTISLQSELGKGSVFSIEIPVE